MAFLRPPCFEVLLSVLLLVGCALYLPRCEGRCSKFSNFTVDQDCTKYTYCDNDLDKFVIVACPEGMAYDDFDRFCRNISVVRPPCPTPSVYNTDLITNWPCEFIGLDSKYTHPHPLLCSVYAHCSLYGYTDYRGCPHGKNYDTVTKKCLDEDQVDCSLNVNYYNDYREIFG